MHGCLQTIVLPVLALDKLDLFVTAEVALSLCEDYFFPKRFTSDMYIVASDSKAADQDSKDSHGNAPSQYGCTSIVDDFPPHQARPRLRTSIT